MAFGFFKKREITETPDNTERAESANTGASDVLLSFIMRGEKITKKQALTIPAIASNTDLICSIIASMPVKLYNYKKGKVEEVKDDPRTALLNSDTGDTLDAYQMKYNMVEDYLLDKGGYCNIEKVGNEVTALYYVEPDYIVINYNFMPIHKSYSIYVEDKTYKPFDFVKLLRRSKTGAYGEGIIIEINEALQTAFQTQLYQLGLVKTGGNKRGFLKSEKKLGEQEMQALKTAWRNLYANNTESVVILNNGLDFKEASNSSVELQLNQSVRSLGEQFDKIFHIGSDFYTTFKLAIYPIIKAFETALNRDLLLENEKGKYFFEFDVKEIIKANIKERFEVYKMAKECGLMTKNEMRREENMNEVDGLDIIDVGLGAVLFNTKTGSYYTPNTGETMEQVKEEEEESIIDEDNLTEGVK